MVSVARISSIPQSAVSFGANKSADAAEQVVNKGAEAAEEIIDNSKKLNNIWKSFVDFFKSEKVSKQLKGLGDKAKTTGTNIFNQLKNIFGKKIVKIGSAILGGVALIATAIKLIFDKKDADVASAKEEADVLAGCDII